MEDWNNDTCVGKYLKTIYDRRIKKSDGIRKPDSVGFYTKSYGGQFHFDMYGFKSGRKILGKILSEKKLRDPSLSKALTELLPEA